MSRRYSVASAGPSDSFVLSPDGWDKFRCMMNAGCNNDDSRELEEWSHWHVEQMASGQWRLQRFYPEMKAK